VCDGVPIIMLSGMAADERLFVAQASAFPNLRVQPWIPPLPAESLRAYAARLAPLVDPGHPCLVGGASFGGVVALELAAHVPALGCILIGSVRSPAGLPWRWRLLRPIAALGPDALGVLTRLAVCLGWPLLAAKTFRGLRRLARPEAAFLRWAMCAVVRWQQSPASRRVRVFHIHGEADRVLPVSLAGPDVVVPGGRHALPLYSPSAVNEFLPRVVRAVSPQGT
jgi:pimeloyl-ACP methyl ester carboxylesterase